MIRMKSIEYNLWMTLLKLLNDRLPNVMREYGFNGTIPVKPSYPRDLSKLDKPSIIIRKVDTSQYKMSMDGFIGQYFDNDHGYVDVKAIRHDFNIQFDVVADNNTTSSIIISAITEDIINNITLSESGRFPLYDFTNINEPTIMGTVTIMSDPSIKPIGDVETSNNYIIVFRCDFTVVQTVVPEQDFVDLSKWIKQNYTIII